MQVVIPAGKREIVLETLEEEGIDYVLSDESSNRQYDAVVSFPLPTNAVEPILDQLRNVGIERDAYTVVTEAQTVASERFEQLEKQYAEEESEDRIARDELRTKADDLASTTSTYTALTIVSAVVATAGLLIDSPATVVGSMVIAPLIGPAMGASVGTVLGDHHLRVVEMELTADYLEKLAASNAEGDAPLSLYAHLPFCEHRCLFCGCHVVITPHMPVAEKYMEYIKKEVDLLAERLPDRRSVVQMHWGGGTPTYFAPAQLEEFFEHVAQYFRFVDGAELAIEVDPRVTNADHLRTLSELGFNRLSMGVQDLTREVQVAIDRNQTYEETAELIATAREIGYTEGINVDLIYGLPKQKLETFSDNLDKIIGMRPDRVAAYSFAYVPWIRGHQKKLDKEDLPSPEVKLQLYLMAMERFLDAGYEAIGMDHFALPDDELAVAAREGRLYRNFMGYTVMPASDMVGVGISGIGEVQHAFFQNEKKLSRYYQALDEDRLPVAKGYLLDPDDVIRQYVIQQIMCNFRVSKADVAERFGIDFDEYFAGSMGRLGPVRDAGFVVEENGEVRVTSEGRLFVRNVCMEFDRYLAEKEAATEEKPVFSRTV